MSWEVGTDVCALPCEKHITSGKLLCSTGSLAQRSVMAEKGGMGWEGRRRGYMCTIADSPHCTTL